MPEYLNYSSYNSKKFMIIYLCCIIVTGLLAYTIFTRYRNETFLKNSSYCQSCGSCCHYCSDITRGLGTLISSYFYSLFPLHFKVHTPSRINNTMNELDADFNDNDDRLNLAEYQVCDETYEAGDKGNDFSDSEDIMQSNKNPYRTLTIKC